MNMKPTLTFLTTLLLAPVAAHADLVAHLRFDGDLKDATGQHDGRPALGRDETDPVVILKRAHLAPDGRCGHTQRAGRGGDGHDRSRLCGVKGPGAPSSFSQWT